MGYAGQVSLGHGAFFAIGGYTSAVLTTHDFSAFKARAWARLAEAGASAASRGRTSTATPIADACRPWAAFVAAMVVTFVDRAA